MPRERQWTVGRPDAEERRDQLEERVLEVIRISRTVAGGKRMRFRALVIVGDRNGRVGMGIDKAAEVAAAIAKATAKAKKSTVEVPIVNDSIPFEVAGKYGSAQIIIKPAPAGTSIIAGGSVRAVLELAGVKNVVSKMLGAPNKLNNARATFAAFAELKHKWSGKRQWAEERRVKKAEKA